MSLRRHSQIFVLIRIIAAKRASAQRSLANGQDDEIASITDFSDDGEKDMYAIFSNSYTDNWLDLSYLSAIAWNICLSFSRFVVSVKMRRKPKIFIIRTEQAQKASQGNFKRQFAMFSSDFRGHANAMVEEMNAYMHVSPYRVGDM